MKRTVFLMLLSVILYGCSGFQLSSTKNEAIVDKISPNIVKVTFCGNAYMNQKEVEKYALQRASTEALSKGCTHFIVLNKNDQSKICAINSRMNKKGSYDPQPIKSSGYLASSELVEPNITMTIQCIPKGEKIPENAIDAEKYLDDNFPELKK